MIDFIKIYTNTKENLETKLKIEFSDTICAVNYFTHEVRYPCRRYFENIEVRITEKAGIIRNSIHKFFNIKNGLGNNNYTDFNYNNILNAFELVQSEIGENTEDYKVTNLEFGLNIKPSLNAKMMLENNFIMFNFDDYSQVETFKNQGYYKQYNRREYMVKIYDKGLHYKLPDNILRFEIKIIDSKLLKKFGIHTFKDICNKNCLKLLFIFLLKTFDEANIVDDFTQEIPQKDRNTIELGKSSSFWRGIKNNKSSSYYYDLRKKYNELLDKYQLLTIKEELRDLLIEKFNLLIEG